MEDLYDAVSNAKQPRILWSLTLEEKAALQMHTTSGEPLSRGVIAVPRKYQVRGRDVLGKPYEAFPHVHTKA